MSFDRRTVLLAGLGLSGASLFGGTLTARKAFAAGATLPADLVDAAKKEGKLNVITLPRDWADYGELMDTFSSRYGIAIDDANPDGTSAEELQAIRSLKTQSRAPDSVDVGPSFAVTGAAEKLFQAYKVATWNEIPDDLKDSSGLWFGDYFGVTSFAVNKAVVKNVPRTWADLLKPEYKGMVAIGGSPLKAGEAFGSVYAAALANGGSFDNIAPGIDFFGKLNSAGNFNPVKCDTGTVVTGQTPIVTSPSATGPPAKPTSTCCFPKARHPTATSTARRSAPTPRTRTPPSCGWNTSIATRVSSASSRATRIRSGSTQCWPPARFRPS
jgi:putative spermidine/putrescine transport system substrate-binding protein